MPAFASICMQHPCRLYILLQGLVGVCNEFSWTHVEDPNFPASYERPWAAADVAVFQKVPLGEPLPDYCLKEQC